MAIVTYDFYISEYLGEAIAQTEFPRYEKRAERIIAQITHGRATEENFAALPIFQQNAVKDAICAQIDYFELYGLDVAISGKTADGWTVGKVRVDGGKSASASVGARSMVSPSAYAALEQTGLLNPQVPALGEPTLLPWWYGGGT